MSIANSAGDWLYGEFLLKYDNLKISLTEGGVGWVPYFLERAEFTLDHHGPMDQIQLRRQTTHRTV